MMSASDAVSKIFSLFSKHGMEPYIGENVSQLQHAQQAAGLAECDGQGEHVIVGAFLHDVGHLVGLEEGLPAMAVPGRSGVEIGTENHEGVGEDFLKEMGFPETVTDFVRGHVEAKRYLVSRYPGYRSGLSEASRLTLIAQGGPMTTEEAQLFEARSDFEALIKMRNWDDQAKSQDVAADPERTEELKEMCMKILSSASSE